MDPLPPPIPGRRPRHPKVAGWLLIGLGLFLSIFMGVITRYMIGVVNAPTVPGSLPHWTGSHEMTVRMFWLFGTVILFGLVSIANGVWLVRRQAFQPALRLVMLLLAAALVISAAITANTGTPP